MNQGPRYVRLMEKSRGLKSRATVPLSCIMCCGELVARAVAARLAAYPGGEGEEAAWTCGDGMGGGSQISSTPWGEGEEAVWTSGDGKVAGSQIGSTPWGRGRRGSLESW